MRGSGFRNNSRAGCFLDGRRYAPIWIKEKEMKCPLVRAGENAFMKVPLEVTLNGYDLKSFRYGFQYYPQIKVKDVNPT